MLVVVLQHCIAFSKAPVWNVECARTPVRGQEAQRHVIGMPLGTWGVQHMLKLHVQQSICKGKGWVLSSSDRTDKRHRTAPDACRWNTSVKISL